MRKTFDVNTTRKLRAFLKTFPEAFPMTFPETFRITHLAITRKSNKNCDLWILL